jgi:hypothetical protein
MLTTLAQKFFENLAPYYLIRKLKYPKCIINVLISVLAISIRYLSFGVARFRYLKSMLPLICHFIFQNCHYIEYSLNISY